MSQRDLTRWNRAGLSRFRYVDGNAVTHLEVLRRALADRFPEWQELTADTAGETVNDRLERLLAQYEDGRRDWLWEIGRGLARAAHVVTEHLDAYANEGFLGTAARWDNVRRLVEMLDYHPAPPASASTSLVLEAKGAGVVGEGFQVKHTPPDGGPPVLFETLDDIDVDPALNALRLAGHDRSPALLSGSTLTLEGRIEKISIGQPVVLEDESKEEPASLQARLVAGVDVGETSTQVTFSEAFVGLAKGHALIHLDPAEALEPFGPTPGEVAVTNYLWLEDEPTILAPKDIVFVSDGSRSNYRRLVNVEGRRISWSSARPLGALDLDTAYVSRARAVAVVADGTLVIAAGDFSSLIDTQVVIAPDAGLVELTVLSAVYRDGETELTLDADAQGTSVVYAPPVGRELEVDSFIQGSDTGPPVSGVETEIPKKTSAGSLAVILRGSRMAWGRLENFGVNVNTGKATTETEGWQDTWQGGDEPFYLANTRVYGHFRQAVRLVGWQENDTPVSGACLDLEVSIPETLVKGRAILLEQDDGDKVHDAVVVSTSECLTLSPAVKSDDGFTVGNTVIRANLVLAGHGESRRERILGGGDATVSYASFVLKQEGVSYVADSTQPSGVRADLTVRVEDRIWRQVATLRDSRATDLHYTARQTEEGYVTIAFGDGRNGQRLPTGTNNVRAAFRVGSGLVGNVAAGSLVKAVRPHRLVDSVRQPAGAKGGNEREDASSLRENAPASVLALERAVSVSDFARLAAGHSSLWQANAFVVTHSDEAPIRPDLERVEVVAVPAGGGALGSLEETIREFLAAHTLPGIDVVVSLYESVLFAISATVRVKSAEADPEVVVEDVRTALFEAFSLQRRKLGQDLYLSDVFAVVEGVSGVQSSSCGLDADATLRRIPASPRQVIYLDPAADQVTLASEEFEL